MRKTYKGLFASDLDGTLLNSGGEFNQTDILAFHLLGDLGYLRVIATGRSSYSFNRLMKERELPVDYLVLSNGAGIKNCHTGKFSCRRVMNADDVTKVANYLDSLKVDYCVQDVFPENHKFIYHQYSGTNSDLKTRIDYYSKHSRRIKATDEFSSSSQIVAVVPPYKTDGILEQIQGELGSSFSVIRTTSPLDGKSLWVEIFAGGVSKSTGTATLSEKHNISRKDTAAIGNDYNDCDLLRWVSSAYVVPHSPPPLLSRFQQVSCSGGTGVAQAVINWLKLQGETIPEGFSSEDICN